MEENEHNNQEQQDVEDVRQSYITKTLGSKGKYKESPTKRVVRISASAFFILLMTVIMLPILFAILLWVASFFA